MRPRSAKNALARRGNDGPFFNGPKFSLVDAAYAPFLQRYTFMSRLRPLGIIEKFPHLAAWRDALLAAPAVKASTVANIEDVWQENLILRKRWLAKYVSQGVLGASDKGDRDMKQDADDIRRAVDDGMQDLRMKKA